MSLTVASRSARLADLIDGPRPHETLARAWLASYRNPKTRDAYERSARFWFCWCEENNIDPLRVVRAHLELWQRHIEGRRTPRSVAARLNALASFYSYLVDEEVLDRDPMRGVNRPKIERTSPTGWLSRPQLADLVAASEHLGVHPHAIICVLALNGLRIGEACSLDVTSLTQDGHYPIIRFTRKGGKEGTAALARPTEAAVRGAIADRRTGPMFLTTAGTRMTREATQRIIDKALEGVRGEYGRITPHALRHSWATACRNAHVPDDQVQHDGGWADSRMVSYYSHGKDSPAGAATHAVAAYVYGAR